MPPYRNRTLPQRRGRIIIPVALVLPAVILFAVSAWAGPDNNMLANGGFEAINVDGMAANWGTRSFGDDEFVTARVSDGGLFGRKCLLMEGKSYPVVFSCFSHPVNITRVEGNKFLLTLSYRTLEQPQADISVNTFSHDFSLREWETPLLSSESIPLDNSANWKTISWQLKLLPSVRDVIVMFRIHGKGTLLVDGVGLRPLPSIVSATIENPGAVSVLGRARECRMVLKNTSSQAANVNVTLLATALGGPGPASRAAQRVALQPGQQQNVTIPYGYPHDPAHQLEVTVQGAQPDIVYDSHIVKVPGLIDAQLVDPAFRSTILQSLPLDDIVVEGRLNASRQLADTLKLSAQLIGARSEPVRLSPAADGFWNVRLPAAGLLAGTYGVRIEAEQNNRIVSTLDLPFTKVAPARKEVGFDAQRRLWVNGKRVFPVGLYYAYEEGDFAEAKEAGANFLILPARQASDRNVRLALENDLYTVISSPTMETRFWENMRDKYAFGNALLGWYVLQRPACQVPPAAPELMHDLYKRLKDISPSHPVIMALSSASRMSCYVDEADIIIPWTEPLPPGDLRSVQTLIRQARETTGGTKPIWPLIQITGRAYSTDFRFDVRDEGRIPTPEEFQCMVYLALAEGADGLCFYSYRLAGTQVRRDFYVKRDAPQLWETVKLIGQQLQALSPVLLDGEPTRLAVGENQGIALRALKLRDSVYVIAANPHDTEVRLSFSITEKAANELHLPLENRMVTAQAGVFTEGIEPFGVRLYVAR